MNFKLYLPTIAFLLLIIGCPNPIEELDPAVCDEGFVPCGEDLQDCCLDTTSHSVTWTVDTIGMAGTSLYDIAVIDEDDIWVVGMIYADWPDTITGNPFTDYNAAHWNGVEWEMVLVPAIIETGAQSYSGVNTVQAFGDSLVMFSNSGSYVQRVNGVWYSEFVEDRPHRINACWGTDVSNMYFVGQNYTGTPGGIVHYDGSNFILQAEVGLPLHDVYGLDENHIWASGWTNLVPGTGGVLLEHDNDSWDIKYTVTSGQDSLGYVFNVFTVDDTLYVTTLKGLWREHIDSGDGYLTPLPEIDSYWRVHRIKGASFNDILLASGDSKYFHWNGVSWEMILDAPSHFGGDRFFAADFYISEDFIVLPGKAPVGGIVFRGERN